MNKVYGYCRISTAKQSIERQIRNIRENYPNADIRQEVFTGTKADRPAWDRLRGELRSGDTVVFDSVSRMSRNADEGEKQYMELFNAGIELVFLKEPHINTAVYREAQSKQIETNIQTDDKDTDEFLKAIVENVNRYMVKLAKRQIRIAFEQSEKEVADLHQRTREGIETARRNGKQIGQQAGKKLEVKKAATAKSQIKQHSRDFGGTLTDAECIKLTGISRNSFYKYKRELREAE